jgi:alpha-galactosidase
VTQAGDRIEIAGKLAVDPVDGTLTLHHRDSAVVAHAIGEAVYRIGGEEKRSSVGGDIAYGLMEDRVSLSAREGDVQLTWQASLAGDGIETVLQITNVASQALTILQLCPLVVSARQGGALLGGSSTETWTFFENGWQSWSPASARQVDGELFSIPYDEEYIIRHHPYDVPSAPSTMVSHWFTVLCDRQSRDSLLLGFITARNQLAEVRLRADAGGFEHLAAVCHTDGVMLSPGETLTSERLLIAAGEDPLSLLQLYADSLGEAMGALRHRESTTGWCSWYYFFGENTAEDVLANLEAAKEHQLSLDVMLIDDGYQGEIGDWLEIDNEKFPQGMSWVAERISDAGYRPGLWVAPFAVSAQSRLYAEHPDWVLRSESGQPVLAWHHWAIPIYALDVSNPEVQAWLRETFLILSEEWGYELLKLDFLYAAAVDGQRHDPQMTRAQALRRGLEIIRETVGEKFLLGCGCPLGPAVGVIDAMRIGPDVAPYWRHYQRDLSAPAAENALRNTVARFFTHRSLWLNDPDCVLVRSRTEDSDLTLSEVRTLVTIVGLCGGVVMSGDDLASVSASRLRYLKSILPPWGEPAIPVDLFDNEVPRTLVLPVESHHGDWVVAALVNWEDRTVHTAIEVDQLGLDSDRWYHVYDFWHRRYLGKARGSLVVQRHRPHETVLLLLKPVSHRPEFLTSTFHVTQGAVEIGAVTREEGEGGGEKMVVELARPGSQAGELLFTVPPPYVVTELYLNGRRRGFKHVAPGVVSLGFHLQGEARVEMVFSRAKLGE